MRAAHDAHVMPPMARSNGTSAAPDAGGAWTVGVVGVVDMAAQSAWWSSAGAAAAAAVAAAMTLAVCTDPPWEKSKNRP